MNDLKTRVLEPTTAHIRSAAELLQAGDVVGMPTETVYGLAGHGLRTDSLSKIFSVKERPTFDPLILHISPSLLPRLTEWVVFPTGKSRGCLDRLIQRYWPGPLTILFKKKAIIPDLATSGSPEVAIRMPSHPVAMHLIEIVGVPLAAPSANRFGRISPTTALDVVKELNGKITVVLDGGPSLVGVESTVIRVTDTGIEILRPGGVSLEELSQTTGVPVKQISIPSAALSEVKSASPGLLENHYAPRTPMILVSDTFSEKPFDDIRNHIWEKKKKHSAKSIALIAVSKSNMEKYSFSSSPLFQKNFYFSDKGSRIEIAQSLFQTLRAADESGVDLIFCENVSDISGLGAAISDRLYKASFKG